MTVNAKEIKVQELRVALAAAREAHALAEANYKIANAVSISDQVRSLDIPAQQQACRDARRAQERRDVAARRHEMAEASYQAVLNL